MKFAFSTLGCPRWEFKDILSTARDLGYDGVEIRGIGNDIYIPDSKLFQKGNIEATKTAILKSGMRLICLTSSAYLHLDDKDYVAEAKAYIDVANEIGTPYVRVLGDTAGEPSDGVDVDKVTQKLINILSYAREKDVVVLLETNGVFADTELALKVVKELNNPYFALLWDIHHTYRYFNESFSDTYDRIGQYVRHIHIKDSVMENGKVKYKMLGHGDIPIKELMQILKKNSYNHFVCLEWLKRWNSELEEPGIIFSHFISKIKSY